jgi:multiple sugar transport system permease protein
MGLSAKSKRKINNNIRIVATYIILIALGIIFTFPFYYMVSKSLMSDKEILMLPNPLLPENPLISNYVKVFNIAPFLRYALNTLIIIVIDVIGVTFSAAMCAYAFARLEFRGRNLMFAIVLAVMMLPGIVVQIPLYVIFSKMGWVNTFLPLTVPAFFGGGSVNIFLMRQFFRTLPKEIDNAAMIDGASKWQLFAKIIIPLSIPVITLVAVGTFIGVWNDFLGPLLYLKDSKMYTLAMGIYIEFKGTLVKNAWPNYEMAMGTMMVIPPAIVFFAFQRNLVSGVATSGMKV